MYVELGAYQRHVFLDFRIVDEAWCEVCLALNGAGVENVDIEKRKLEKGKDDEPKISTKKEIAEEDSLELLHKS